MEGMIGMCWSKGKGTCREMEPDFRGSGRGQGNKSVREEGEHTEEGTLSLKVMKEVIRVIRVC